MTGLILKDFLVMKKTLGWYLFLMVAYAVLAFTGVFTYSIISGFVIMIAIMAPVSAFAYDEQARWDKFAASTPVGRQGVVKARYLFTLLLLLGGGVLSMLVTAVVVRIGTPPVDDWWEPLVVAAAIWLVGMLQVAVILPILFKFGAEKSRIINLIVFVVGFGGIIGLLTWASGREGVDLALLSERIAALPPAVLVLGPVAFIFVLFWLSYRLSVGIYGRKEL